MNRTIDSQIRAAQFLSGGLIHCVDANGKLIEITREPSVKAFLETKLRKKRITDSTTIYVSGQKKTVGELKKELKIGSWWFRIFGG